MSIREAYKTHDKEEGTDPGDVNIFDKRKREHNSGAR
jgi:hypothetical protein